MPSPDKQGGTAPCDCKGRLSDNPSPARKFGQLNSDIGVIPHWIETGERQKGDFATA